MFSFGATGASRAELLDMLAPHLGTLPTDVQSALRTLVGSCNVPDNGSLNAMVSGSLGDPAIPDSISIIVDARSPARLEVERQPELPAA